MSEPAAVRSVLEVLLDRRDRGSRPGDRDDEHRVALAIEGGGNRAAYSAGMTIALEELGLTTAFDAVYGTSGGALNAAWLLTGEAARWLPSWAWPEVAAAGVTDPRRVLRGGPVIDLRVLTEHVYSEITPMDVAAIVANPITFHPIATDARTGDPVDLAPLVRSAEDVRTALRASSCLPLLAGRPVRFGGRTFLDGGLSEAIPYRTALDQGATHVLVLRTRRTDQRLVPSRAERIVLAPYFTALARGAGRSHGRRHLTYGEADRELGAYDAEARPRVAQVRPPAGSADVDRLSSDLEGVAAALEVGRVTLTELFRSQERGRPD